jgi:hypothetical protein
MCMVLWWTGAFYQFVFWTITRAAECAAASSLVNAPALLRAALHVVVGADLLFWLLPWVGALVMWWDERLDEGSLKSEVQSSRSEVHRLAFCNRGFF